MKNIGLFGGTFNPIHYGHLRPAEEIGELLDLDPVVFLPASDPPHKGKSDLLPAPLRAEMVKLAIADNPRFSFSDAEIAHPGKSYSVETLPRLQKSWGRDAQIYFLLGLDAFLEIGTWKEPAVLFTLCHFVIMTRPGFQKFSASDHLPVDLAGDFCYDPKQAGYMHKSGFGVFPRDITALDISSTRIREMIRRGASIRYLVPPAVERLIAARGFYRKGI